MYSNVQRSSLAISAGPIGHCAQCKWCCIAREVDTRAPGAEEHLLELLITAARRSQRLRGADQHTVIEVADDAYLRVMISWERYTPGRCFGAWASRILATEICHVGRTRQTERARRQCDLCRNTLLRELEATGATAHLARLENLRSTYGSWESLYHDARPGSKDVSPLDSALNLVREDSSLPTRVAATARRLGEHVTALRLSGRAYLPLPLADELLQARGTPIPAERSAADRTNATIIAESRILYVLTAGLETIPRPARDLVRRILDSPAESRRREDLLHRLADYLEQHPRVAATLRESGRRRWS